MKNIAIEHYDWEENFPPIYGHTSISFLKRCYGFNAAKHGDMQAALSIASICIKENRIKEMKNKYPTATLLPVITQNKLPVALAEIIGLKINTEVSVIHTRVRKDMTAMERLLHAPDFTGSIIKGEEYILVDDIVTQGGTISALRKHVISCGGTVVAVAALAYSAGNNALAPEPENIITLNQRFDSVSDILKDNNISNNISELTNRQIKYLLRFKEISRILNKINDIHNLEDYSTIIDKKQCISATD